MENLNLPETYNPQTNSLSAKVEKKINKFRTKAVSSKIMRWLGYRTIIQLFYLFLFRKYKSKCLIAQSRHQLGMNIHISFREIQYGNNLPVSVDEMSFTRVARQLANCIKDNVEVIIIPLHLDTDSGGHANVLIYRKNGNMIEHFEPHGAAFGLDPEFSNALDNKLTYFINILNNELSMLRLPVPVIFEKSSKVCPSKFGLQAIEGYVKNTILDTGESESSGYCAVWSMFFTELALSNPTIPSDELVRIIIKKSGFNIFNLTDMNTRSLYLKDIVRGYVIYISEKIEKYFSIVFGEKVNVETIIKSHDDDAKLSRIWRIVMMIIEIEFDMMNPYFDIDADIDKYQHIINRDRLSIDEKDHFNTKLLILRNITRIDNDSLSLTSQSVKGRKSLSLKPGSKKSMEEEKENKSLLLKPGSKPLIEILEEKENSKKSSPPPKKSQSPGHKNETVEKLKQEVDRLTKINEAHLESMETISRMTNRKTEALEGQLEDCKKKNILEIKTLTEELEECKKKNGMNHRKTEDLEGQLEDCKKKNILEIKTLTEELEECKKKNGRFETHANKSKSPQKSKNQSSPTRGKKERCKKGTRRNPKTGNCEEK